MPLVYAAILIGVLIFVHEAGHFLVAKLFDVKVLRFSIGFGPKVVGFHRGETEYVICALPLGGYVQMLGMTMESTEDIPEEDLSRALMAKPIWQRSLVVLAGPVFNLIFPVIIYFGVVLTMNTAVAPAMVGDVFAEMPAAEAGLRPGDAIVEIEGEEVSYWHQVISHVTPNPGKELTVTYERDGERHEAVITPEEKSSTDFLGLNTHDYGLIGIHSGTYGPTVGIVQDDGAAAEAGMRSFDRVMSIDGEAIERFDQIESKVRASAGRPMEFALWRRESIPVQYGQFYSQHRVDLTVTPRKSGGEWSIDVRRAEMFLSSVDAGGPADEAGLQIGDEVLAVDGKKFSNWLMMNRHIENAINEKIARTKEEDGDFSAIDTSVELTVQRGDDVFTTTFAPLVRQLDIEDYFRVVTGWGHVPDMVFPDKIAFPFGERFVYSIGFAFNQTWEFCRMTFIGLLRMAQGRMSLDNLGGPIMIGELAAQAGRAGWDKFLEMMALISINLALINLLPIPILDGGNLMLFALEAIKRGPLSFRTRQIAAYIGFTMILMLIVLAFKNDIERQWDNIAEYVNEL